MTFREFVSLWEENWHLDPEHVWFMDPHMSRFLSPAELQMMYQKQAERDVDDRRAASKDQEKNWKNRGVDPGDDPELTQAFGADEPEVTSIYRGGPKGTIAQHSITHSRSGDSTTPAADWKKLTQELSALKRRLDQLEKQRDAAA